MEIKKIKYFLPILLILALPVAAAIPTETKFNFSIDPYRIGVVAGTELVLSYNLTSAGAETLDVFNVSVMYGNGTFVLLATQTDNNTSIESTFTWTASDLFTNRANYHGGAEGSSVIWNFTTIANDTAGASIQYNDTLTVYLSGYPATYGADEVDEPVVDGIIAFFAALVPFAGLAAILFLNRWRKGKVKM